jgi:hypothetical protein
MSDAAQFSIQNLDGLKPSRLLLCRLSLVTAKVASVHLASAQGTLDILTA